MNKNVMLNCDEEAKDILTKTNELFCFMENQEKLQLQIIELIQEIDPKCITNNQELSLTQAINCLTKELRRSINASKCSDHHSIQDKCNENKNIYNQAKCNDFNNIRILTQDKCKDRLLNQDKNHEYTIRHLNKECDKNEPIKKNFKEKGTSNSYDTCLQTNEKEVRNIPIVSHASSQASCDEHHIRTPSPDCCDENTSIISKNSKLKVQDCFQSLRNDFNSISKPCIYIYVVDNFMKKVNKCIEEWSEPFYTSHVGYRMKAKLGFSSDYLGIYVKLVEGDHDDLVNWPFCNEIAFTLINQICESNSITRILKPHPNDCDEIGYWDKPKSNCDYDKGGWGFSDFVETCIIRGPYDDYVSDFIRNDRLYIKIQLASR